MKTFNRQEWYPVFTDEQELLVDIETIASQVWNWIMYCWFKEEPKRIMMPPIKIQRGLPDPPNVMQMEADHLVFDVDKYSSEDESDLYTTYRYGVIVYVDQLKSYINEYCGKHPSSVAVTATVMHLLLHEFNHFLMMQEAITDAYVNYDTETLKRTKAAIKSFGTAENELLTEQLTFDMARDMFFRRFSVMATPVIGGPYDQYMRMRNSTYAVLSATLEAQYLVFCSGTRNVLDCRTEHIINDDLDIIHTYGKMHPCKFKLSGG